METLVDLFNQTNIMKWLMSMELHLSGMLAVIKTLPVFIRKFFPMWSGLRALIGKTKSKYYSIFYVLIFNELKKKLFKNSPNTKLTTQCKFQLIGQHFNFF